MDWPKARAILLVAFMVVNLVLGYSIWGPTETPSGVAGTPNLDQVRARLAEGSLVLPPSVDLPRVPDAMQFLHVEYRSTPDFLASPSEESGTASHDPSIPGSLGDIRSLFTLDPDTQAYVYRPEATGSAAREVNLDNPNQVQQAAEAYLQQMSLLPDNVAVTGAYARPESDTAVVEFVPRFGGHLVFSGYIRVEVSSRGIESVSILWVEPRGYTSAPPKAIRPVGEALLRLAGRLAGEQTKAVTEIKLGYYAGRTLTATQAGSIQGWDTVPVWRIRLDSGEVYYINAFNGEWES